MHSKTHDVHTQRRTAQEQLSPTATSKAQQHNVRAEAMRRRGSTGPAVTSVPNAAPSCAATPKLCCAQCLSICDPSDTHSLHTHCAGVCKQHTAGALSARKRHGLSNQHVVFRGHPCAQRSPNCPACRATLCCPRRMSMCAALLAPRALRGGVQVVIGVVLIQNNARC
jgi:hypothetical protein